MTSLQTHLTAFETACRDAGLKLTHQRLELYRELLLAVDHPTAELLYQRLRTKLPTISLDTVYRTLATLAGHGLVNKVETTKSLARFEAALFHHHHLICLNCSDIKDFEWPFMDRAVLPEDVKNWGKAARKSVVVYGICNHCLKIRS